MEPILIVLSTLLAVLIPLLLAWWLIGRAAPRSLRDPTPRRPPDSHRCGPR